MKRQPDQTVDDGEVVADLRERRADTRRVSREELDHTVCPLRQAFNGMQREIGVARQLVGPLPQSRHLLGWNPPIGILHCGGVQSGGLQQTPGVEAEPSARLQHGAARDRQHRSDHDVIL